jgi:hypothetical protein
LTVSALVCLHVFELTLSVALGIKLLARRAAMGCAFGWHGSSLRGKCLKAASDVPSTDEP